MIGTVVTGSSFYHLISYVLEDKKDLSETQKKEVSLRDGVQHKDRAEILAFNNCFGDKYEMAEQFRDVARLSKRVEKAVFHLSIRLAEGDHLTKDQLIELGEALVKEFNVEDHQYLMVFHKDTREQHFHIVANRVGLDGKAASDSNSYKRMAAFCRKQEQRLGLTQVLSPKAFLSKDRQLIPRQDQRKIKLKEHIQKILKEVNDYPAFENAMHSLGYTVIKGIGISFIDGKKVKIKGSDVGFSLSKIERILSLKTELANKQLEQKNIESYSRKQSGKNIHYQDDDRLQYNNGSPLSLGIQNLTNLIEWLLQPEMTGNSIPYELTQEAYDRRQKRKKKGRSH
ncbi:relaxase/mobilization nuclease domain-containing protein [Chitinophaga sp. 22321]|uniref:Relaxase/mobilization nuclease domain-containing protein n=1 Tax=Chitinophaga hostae TaxID=2831022 RepID=A0ABS5JB16_9BACT|nr:relaxase/mobilization nuclease domain-containing protein [Chitinophaga hostae]